MTTPANECAPQVGAALFRERLARGEAVLGCFLSLGSAQTAELMAAAGYDWALIDLEHGAGDEGDALAQMQALATRRCITIVRVESAARQRVHRVLDFGAHGIMFPRIDTCGGGKGRCRRHALSAGWRARRGVFESRLWVRFQFSPLFGGLLVLVDHCPDRIARRG